MQRAGAPFTWRQTKGRKEDRGRGSEERSEAAGPVVRGECSSGAASGCAPASRSRRRPGDYLPWSSPHRAWNVCATGENIECWSRGVCRAASRRVLRTFPASASSSAPLPGLSLHRGPYLAPLKSLGGLRPPARRRCLDPRGSAPNVTRFVCVGLAGGAEPPAPRPPPAPRGNPGEETPREKSKGKQPAWICLPGTFAAHADSLRERAGAAAPPPPRPGGRGPRVGKQCVAAEVLGAAGPGVPRDVALNVGARTGGSRSRGAPSGRCAPPSAPSCVAGGPPARPASACFPA